MAAKQISEHDSTTSVEDQASLQFIALFQKALLDPTTKHILGEIINGELTKKNRKAGYRN